MKRYDDLALPGLVAAGVAVQDARQRLADLAE